MKFLPVILSAVRSFAFANDRTHSKTPAPLASCSARPTHYHGQLVHSRENALNVNGAVKKRVVLDLSA
jgi:hypothetical protein